MSLGIPGPRARMLPPAYGYRYTAEMNDEATVAIYAAGRDPDAPGETVSPMYVGTVQPIRLWRGKNDTSDLRAGAPIEPMRIAEFDHAPQPTDIYCRATCLEQLGIPRLDDDGIEREWVARAPTEVRADRSPQTWEWVRRHTPDDDLAHRGSHSRPVCTDGNAWIRVRHEEDGPDAPVVLRRGRLPDEVGDVIRELPGREDRIVAWSPPAGSLPSEVIVQRRVGSEMELALLPIHPTRPATPIVRGQSAIGLGRAPADPLAVAIGRGLHSFTTSAESLWVLTTATPGPDAGWMCAPAENGQLFVISLSRDASGEPTVAAPREIELPGDPVAMRVSFDRRSVFVLYRAPADQPFGRRPTTSFLQAFTAYGEPLGDPIAVLDGAVGFTQ